MAVNSLRKACREGVIETVRSILSHDDVDINIKDADGKSMIQLAAENGHKDICDFLIDKGCDVLTQDNNKRTILHSASIGGNTELIQSVLSPKIEVNSFDNEGMTPAMLAAGNGNEAAFFLLIKEWVNFNLADCKGNTILHYACYGGNRNIVEYLLSKRGADVHGTNIHGITPIMSAARHGHRDVFKLLAEREGALSKADDQNRSMLLLASEGGDDQIVEQVLSKDMGSLNKRDDAKRTPVIVSALKGHREVFYLLVTQGCDLTGTTEDGNSIIHHACIGGSVEIVEYILSQDNIDIDKKGQSEMSPVMFAARNGHKRVFEVLVFRKCDLSIVDNKRNTVLHHAALGGNVEIVRFLLSHNIIGINCQGRYGMTPVMMATLKGQDDVFHLLVSKLCDMTSMCDFSYNVLHIACLTDNRYVTDYILSNDILPATGRGQYHRTPMMMAADKGHKEIFDLFVQKGCDFSISDEQGLNILHIACIGGNVDIIQYITSLKLIDINTRSGHFKRTPVMIAAERNRKEAFDFLISKDCDLSLEDTFGNNVLHSACVGGGREIVEFILEQNILDPSKMSKVGDSPIMLAALNNHNDIVDLLKSKGCKMHGCVIS